MNIYKDFFFQDDTVKIVIAKIDEFDAYLPRLFSYLSLEESNKVNKLQFKHLKKRYTISHGLLRLLLGKYLDISPLEIEYTYNKYQKPYCKPNSNLYFNMTHSNDYVCYVFSFNYEVGIDIECIKKCIEVDNLLSLVAAPSEVAIFSNINATDKIYLFYKLWTTKEAFLKALGCGLNYPLTAIETYILPFDKFGVLTCNGSKDIKKVWTFEPINLIPGYVGSIAVKKENGNMKFKSLHLSCGKDLSFDS